MTSVTLAFGTETVPGGSTLSIGVKFKGSKKVESVGRKRPTYYTCEKRLTGTTGMHAQSF